ncbi:MBOAT family protein [Ktedonosporobacter rubrisoli]|uniref:MBOAT family protein n=1 Tax=Ktedonosporobacter rubrisoli TaxID=2509675 RepID=A0A4P6JQL1_KTERU|nr:MBOAT family O-acyltransferase [Ktedonosporobacter rubrisoli]QBD77432.1 MBOAT family protein [Ktedonosporobacter rubrisoli]
MVFSSLFFTFAFLPITLILYYTLGKRLRNIVLLVVSLIFYAWGEPVYILLMCASIIVNYFLGILLGKAATARGRTLFFIFSLLFNVGCLAYFKYAGMLIKTVEALSGVHLLAAAPALPLGISFYTFHILSYVIDVYRGKIRPQKSLVLFALYISMFPQLVAGPIVKYADIEAQLTDRSITFQKFHSGMNRFLCGLAKKVLLANTIGLLWSEVKALPGAELSVLMAWIGIVAFTLQIYFDFSGYSDMAIGLGKMLGFRFKENFRYPYISQSVSEFWRRWHISLGSWFRDYVYIPLGGNRAGTRRTILNLFVVWFLTGLWHGASWNFVFWGLYFGVLIMLEKVFLEKQLKRWPQAVRHIYLLLCVVIGWVFFDFPNLGDALRFLGTMFGLGGAVFINAQTIAKLEAYSLLLFICVIAATPWPKILGLSLRNKVYRASYKTGVVVYYCVLMFFSTAYLVGSTFNPFIYFRF